MRLSGIVALYCRQCTRESYCVMLIVMRMKRQMKSQCNNLIWYVKNWKLTSPNLNGTTIPWIPHGTRVAPYLGITISISNLINIVYQKFSKTKMSKYRTFWIKRYRGEYRSISTKIALKIKFNRTIFKDSWKLLCQANINIDNHAKTASKHIVSKKTNIILFSRL